MDFGVVAEDESDFPMETGLPRFFCILLTCCVCVKNRSAVCVRLCFIDMNFTKSDSDSNTKVIAVEDSGIQKFDLSTIEARTLDEYLEIMHKSDPPIDYSKAPKPFAFRMVPRLHYSLSDSDDSSDFSDSDFECEKEFELQKENSPEDTTKEVEFQPNATLEDLMSGLNAPASSILLLPIRPIIESCADVQEEVSEIQNMIIPKPVLVKHGTKREAEIDNKGSEIVKKMASQMEGSGKKSTDIENQVVGA
ncbi:hypothetical protein POM88_050858 [Heracleum sosnowskyi]|uniref:Uncharacterized protein n=1 Tax=Heracleum sosnowskyi TaxID=360622 RepID=A0AAD8M2X4_9APIA|nr:hypothetical protein POM88_050858 [Heracleum sosnowskyi]